MATLQTSRFCPMSGQFLADVSSFVSPLATRALRCSRITMAFGLTLALCALGACERPSPTAVDPLDVDISAAVSAAGRVASLTVASVTDSTITVRWTQVDDGLGRPASYRV